MDSLAKPAIAALKAKKVVFFPENKRTQLISYLEGLHDWNISRQIAWGIPIPAFQNVDAPEDWIYDERVTEEIIQVDGKTYHRDADVFDTWFSSSSWPYATLNYPEADFKEFYPLDLMETGFDILYPWVSRMLMFGLYTTNAIPFKAVYLHGLIQDEQGQKMSKSKGNVINPMDVVDDFGSDAMRMGLIKDESPAANRPFDRSKVVGARNFCNKLWNIARFVEGLGMGDGALAEPKTAADHWVLSKLQSLQHSLEKDLDAYRFAEGYEKLYHFIWDDLADWYLEASKAAPNVVLLRRILANILALTHPFAPFVTETIWQTLDEDGDSLLATSRWPQIVKGHAKPAAEFEAIKTIVTEARAIIKSLHATDVTLYYTNVPFLKDNAAIITQMARLNGVTEVRDGTGVYLTQTAYRCWLDIDAATASHYADELEAKQQGAEHIIAQLEGRLANKAYVDHAPKHVVDQTRDQLKDAHALLESLSEERKRFV